MRKPGRYRPKAPRERVAHCPSVTACLLSWRRPRNLQPIVETLRKLDLIDEILIWNNNTTVELIVDDPIVRVINSDGNLMCYGRFLCASQARNQLIYVQDDDAVNCDVAGLYQTFLVDPGRIVHAVTAKHYQDRQRNIYDTAHVALLGWGAFLLKEWISVFDQLPAEVFEEPLFLREADKIFTMLLGTQHNTILGNIELLEGHSSPSTALWRDPSHRLLCSQAVTHTLRWMRSRRNGQTPVPWNVVITCHNYGEYLQDAVTSVLANDADYEIHIVDDGSNDITVPKGARRRLQIIQAATRLRSR
jgi:hypothetical protein